MIRCPGAVGLTRSLWLALALSLGACDSKSPLVSSESPLTPIDSLDPPGDPIVPPPPPDTTTPPPPTNPPDSTAPPQPPPDTTGPSQPPPPAPPPVHVGIPIGPAHVPVFSYDQVFSGALQNGQPLKLLAELEEARRASARVMVSFTGSEQWNRDSDGFSMTKWKQRVDRFRSIDFSSYVEDGTLLGHFIMDEPSDPRNWSGTRVSLSQIDEMANYSKGIWPSLPTIIRAWPSYLEGYHFKNLDAIWVQYHVRFGDIDTWIRTNIRGAESLGLAVVTGLNVINGGGDDSGMPAYENGKHAMNPAQLKSWGGRLLSENPCLFVFWEYRSDYFSRADVKAAVEELSQTARGRPKKACRN